MKKSLLLFNLFISFFGSVSFAQNLSLGNSVWYDMNDNGIKESSEPGWSGVIVRLYLDNDEDGIADAGFTTLSTTTDATGNYLFSNLSAGKYFVRINTNASHFMSRVYGGDPDNNIFNDNNGYIENTTTYRIYTQTITLEDGTEPDGSTTNTNTNKSVDIGVWKDNGLGDMVWLDVNGNGMYENGEPGLPNVTVMLKDVFGNVLETTQTNTDGKYFFYAPLGKYGTEDYQIQFLPPSGYEATSGNAGGDDNVDSDPVGGVISNVHVPMGKWDHSFDAGFIPAAIMPVTMLQFTATKNDSKVLLQWSVTNEINIDHYSVEKSTDGQHYYKTGSVSGNSDAGSIHSYSYIDELTGTNTVPAVYYRIKSADKSGRFQLSDIRIIKTDYKQSNALIMSVYPNPAVNVIFINTPPAWNGGKVLYEITNLSGSVISKMIKMNDSRVQSINVEHYANGLYILKATGNGSTLQQKFIKQ